MIYAYILLFIHAYMVQFIIVIFYLTKLTIGDVGAIGFCKQLEEIFLRIL